MTVRSPILALLILTLALTGTTASAAPLPQSRRWLAETTDGSCPTPKADVAKGGKNPKQPAPTAPKSAKPHAKDSETTPSKDLPQSWHVAPAFAAKESPDPTRSRLPLPLSRFCVYSAKYPTFTPPSFEDTDRRKIVKIDADYDVLLPQAGPPIPTPVGDGDPADIDLDDLGKLDPGTSHPDPSQPKDPPDYLAPEAERKIRAAAAKVFAEGVGATPTGSQTAPKAYGKGNGQAFIAIVDTAPGSMAYAKAGFERHGLAMAAIANTIRCPWETGDITTCRDRTFFAQAFPYTRAPTFLAKLTPAQLPLLAAAEPSARRVGSSGSLAQGIWQAIAEWRQRRQSSTTGPLSPGAPLVLNLSLAWNPLYGDIPATLANHLRLLDNDADAIALRAQIPVQVRMIHTALVYASCLDVLTIAAAGNSQVDGCDAVGPLAPGSWERLRAPTLEECKLLFPGESFDTRRPGDPRRAANPALVYAVGGMADEVFTENDLMTPRGPLATSRPGGIPPRLIMAARAVVDWQGQWTEAWTGTSVAAAAYSGLAAALWTQRPNLTPHQLVTWIDSTGEQHTTSDFPSPRPANIVTAHRAYDKICPGTGCNVNPYKAPSLGYGSQLNAALATAVTQNVWTAGAPSIGGEGKLVATPVNLGCKVKRDHYAPQGSGPQALPPHKHQIPWLRPQPEAPICSVCPIKGNKLSLTPNEESRGTYWPAQGDITLKNVTLRLGDTSYNLGDIRMSGGVEIDLGKYEVSTPSGTRPLFEPTSLLMVNEGTLTISVEDAGGGLATMTSVVQVLH